MTKCGARLISCGHGSLVANAILEALHTSCDQARRAGDSLAVMYRYTNAILEALYLVRAIKAVTSFSRSEERKTERTEVVFYHVIS